jgi:hypothetical protein
MENWPEREAKLLLVTKIENQERIIFENLVAGRKHLRAGGSHALESIHWKKRFQINPRAMCGTGPWRPARKKGGGE